MKLIGELDGFVRLRGEREEGWSRAELERVFMPGICARHHALDAIACRTLDVYMKMS